MVQVYGGETGPPSQGWTLLHNHAHGIAAMDLLVVPTISFRLLCSRPRHCPTETRRDLTRLGNAVADLVSTLGSKIRRDFK